MIYDGRVCHTSLFLSLGFSDNVVWLQGTRMLSIACFYLDSRVFDPEMVLKLLRDRA